MSNSIENEADGVEKSQRPDVILGLGGEWLIPEKATKLLKFEPTMCFKKGDVFASKSGIDIERKTGRWVYETKDFVDSIDTHVHVDHILDKLQFCLQPMTSLPGVTDARLSCIVSTSLSGDTEEVCLTNEQIRRLGILDLELVFVVIPARPM